MKYLLDTHTWIDIGRGESCLIVGFTNSGKPVHVVCGLNENSLVIITVYTGSS